MSAESRGECLSAWTPAYRNRFGIICTSLPPSFGHPMLDEQDRLVGMITLGAGVEGEPTGKGGSRHAATEAIAQITRMVFEFRQGGR